MSSVEEHRRQAPQTVSCMVLTVSDTRQDSNDKSGSLIKQLLVDHEHYTVAHYAIVPDEYHPVQSAVQQAALNPAIDAILINGGTGMAKRDITIEAVTNLMQKEMPGFGELFRYLSFTEDIGPAAMLSRASAGVIDDTAVFCMPGSTGAVRLAMQTLILPELGHLIRELRKDLQ